MAEIPNVPAGGNYDPDSLSRIIMLLYGKMDHGGPFWCYVAIKPSQFETFKAAEAAGDIDLYNFEAFGEVIVSAEGKTPPSEVTAKVAEMYGADPSTFFQPIDPMAEISKKIDELKAKDGE
jgi:hypothetical protein